MILILFLPILAAGNYCEQSVGPRIIKGDESEPHSLPSIVRVNKRLTDAGDICKERHCGSCGGTIVNKNWILTGIKNKHFLKKKIIFLI